MQYQYEPTMEELKAQPMALPQIVSGETSGYFARSCMQIILGSKTSYKEQLFLQCPVIDEETPGLVLYRTK